MDHLLQLHEMCVEELQQLTNNIEYYLEGSGKMLNVLCDCWQAVSSDNAFALIAYDRFLTSLSNIMDLARKFNIHMRVHKLEEEHSGRPLFEALQLSGINAKHCNGLKQITNEVSTKPAADALIISANDYTHQSIPPIEENGDVDTSSSALDFTCSPPCCYTEKDVSAYGAGSLLKACVSYVQDLPSLRFYVCDVQDAAVERMAALRCMLQLRQYTGLPPENEVFGLVVDDNILRAVRTSAVEFTPSEQIAADQERHCVLLLDFGEVLEMSATDVAYHLPADLQQIPAQAMLCELSGIEGDESLKAEALQQCLQEMEYARCTFRVEGMREGVLFLKLLEEKLVEKEHKIEAAEQLVESVEDELVKQETKTLHAEDRPGKTPHVEDRPGKTPRKEKSKDELMKKEAFAKMKAEREAKKNEKLQKQQQHLASASFKKEPNSKKPNKLDKKPIKDSPTKLHATTASSSSNSANSSVVTLPIMKKSTNPFIDDFLDNDDAVPLTMLERGPEIYLNNGNTESLPNGLTLDDMEMLQEEPLNTSNAMVAVMGYNPKDEQRLCRFFNPKTGCCFKGANCRQEHTAAQPEGWTKDCLPAATIVDNHQPVTRYAHGMIINITVTYVGALERFYAQINNLKAPMQPLIWNAEDITPLQHLRHPPLLFELVLARYEDGLWYRAMVEESDELRKMFKVFYVDYGNSQFVPLRDLARCDAASLRQPHQATLCRLADIVADAEATPEKRKQGINILNKLILNQSFDVKVLSHHEELVVRFLGTHFDQIPNTLVAMGCAKQYQLVVT